ncbi:hypothetical protein BT96DRAFT_532520 [Gymnopus androsaceus JB14]|uniref:Uncharacterized protein n=1 Tax=Gymnopus androsaceus JB14 TaxID=1447944 RepID=A0A6A4IMM4_9AGAR|nr:hypothetical protein BT96DRAFT_532520 [Gymnopus androsaceus JB14]
MRQGEIRQLWQKDRTTWGIDHGFNQEIYVKRRLHILNVLTVGTWIIMLSVVAECFLLLVFHWVRLRRVWLPDLPQGYCQDVKLVMERF